MKALIRWARRYFLFESWAWDQPDAAARRRATWPRWRLAVRPIGALAWWISGALALAYEAASRHAPVPIVVIGSVLVGFAICCAAFGIVDGFRQRRLDRRVRLT